MLKFDAEGDEHDDDLEAEVIEGTATETGIETVAFPEPDDATVSDAGASNEGRPTEPGESSAVPSGDEAPDSL